MRRQPEIRRACPACGPPGAGDAIGPHCGQARVDRRLDARGRRTRCRRSAPTSARTLSRIADADRAASSEPGRVDRRAIAGAGPSLWPALARRRARSRSRLYLRYDRRARAVLPAGGSGLSGQVARLGRGGRRSESDRAGKARLRDPARTPCRQFHRGLCLARLCGRSGAGQRYDRTCRGAGRALFRWGQTARHGESGCQSGRKPRRRVGEHLERAGALSRRGPKMRAPRFWARVPPTPLARLLQPLGGLYGWAVARNMERRGERAAAPVICVGNFVAGGAGKTPAAIALARLLIEMGERVAFLSRGYGGATRAGPGVVDPRRHGAAQVGDEPLLLARVAPTFVSRDRPRAARAAIAAGAGVLVLDDGLQNPALAKDFTLALVDGGFGFGNGLCLPAGPLRAPLAAQASHVALIVVVAGAKAIEAPATLAGKPIVAAWLEPDASQADELRGTNVFAFAGIGRPEKFFETLEGLGARLVAKRSFPDHHRFAASELEAIFGEASNRSLAVVTTEKDFVRLPAAYAQRTVVLPVTLRFDDAGLVARLLAGALAHRRAEA